MAQEQVPTFEFRYYDYSPQGEPVGPDEVPGDCPACRGTGKVLLLVSTRPCEACGGTGKASGTADFTPAAWTDSTDSTSSPPAGSPQADLAASPQACWSSDDDVGDAGKIVVERVKGHWVSTSTYDDHDRLRSVVETFVPDAAEDDGKGEDVKREDVKTERDSAARPDG